MSTITSFNQLRSLKDAICKLSKFKLQNQNSLVRQGGGRSDPEGNVIQFKQLAPE